MVGRSRIWVAASLAVVIALAMIAGCTGGGTPTGGTAAGTTVAATTIIPFKTATDQIVALQAGNVDAAINDSPVMQFLTKDPSKGLKVIGEAPTAELYGIAVAKGNPALLAAINDGLAKVKASGEYDKLYKQWFGVAPSASTTGATSAAAKPAAGAKMKLVTPGQITVGSDISFPPFESMKADGVTAEGFDVDLMKAIAKRFGVNKVVFQNATFDTLVPSLAAGGKYDVVVSGIFITAERKKSVDFSNPYGVANQGIAVKVGSPIKAISDLAGKKIAVQSGTTGELWAKENFK